MEPHEQDPVPLHQGGKLLVLAQKGGPQQTPSSSFQSSAGSFKPQALPS